MAEQPRLDSAVLLKHLRSRRDELAAAGASGAEPAAADEAFADAGFAEADAAGTADAATTAEAAVVDAGDAAGGAVIVAAEEPPPVAATRVAVPPPDVPAIPPPPDSGATRVAAPSAAAAAKLDRLSKDDVAEMSPADVEAATAAVVERIEGTLIRTYRHLRLVLVAAAPAILIAIAIVWNSGYPGLPSISHYYYTPARIIFAGALVTASAALLALSGRGSQRGWLDLAALFAPLIALVPTKIGNDEVPGLNEACPSETDCIPGDVQVYITTGMIVWFVFAALVLGYGVVAALVAQSGRDAATPQEPRSVRGTWIPIITGAVIVALYAGFWLWGNDLFLDRAHFVSASIFFVIITIVAVGQARRAFIAPPGDTRPAGWWTRFRRRVRRELAWIPKAFTTVPGWIAVLMALDIVAAVVVLRLGLTEPIVLGSLSLGTVFVIEAIALALFTVFWLFETVRKWNEADPE